MCSREKRRDLTQSHDKNPYTHRKIQKATWQHKNATKSSITQRLRVDLGRSVGVTTATQLVWLSSKVIYLIFFKANHLTSRSLNNKHIQCISLIFNSGLGRLSYISKHCQRFSIRVTYSWHISYRTSRLNDATTSEKGTYFLDLKCSKVIDSNIRPSACYKRVAFRSLKFLMPLVMCMACTYSCGIYISQLVRFARCYSGGFNFHSKNLSITSKLLTRGYWNHKLRKTFGILIRSCCDLFFFQKFQE